MASFAELEDDIPQQEPTRTPATQPAVESADARRAKLEALVARQKQAQADPEGGSKKKSKDGEKKRKRDKGEKGDKSGTKSRPVRTPGAGDRQQVRSGRDDGPENSVDSRELKETAADHDFIDDDGATGLDAELMSDADNEDARLAAAPEAVEGEEAEDATETLFGRKKKKKGEESFQALITYARTLAAEMDIAAEADMDARREGKPAFNKLRLLARVEEVLAQRKYHEPFMIEGGLGALKGWLEPYGDGALPNVRIRTAVLNFCKALPIDTSREDVKDQLKKSMLGSRVMFLAKCPDESLPNKKIAMELIQKWSRPIFFDPEAEAEKRRQREESMKLARAAAIEQQKAAEAREEAERAAKNKIKYGQAGYRWHASIPQTLKLDYVVAPQLPEVERQSSQMASGKKEESKLDKKLREVVRKRKSSNARAAAPSVEGRNIVLMN